MLSRFDSRWTGLRYTHAHIYIEREWKKNELPKDADTNLRWKRKKKKAFRREWNETLFVWTREMCALITQRNEMKLQTFNLSASHSIYTNEANNVIRRRRRCCCCWLFFHIVYYILFFCCLLMLSLVLLAFKHVTKNAFVQSQTTVCFRFSIYADNQSDGITQKSRTSEMTVAMNERMWAI